MSWENKSKNAVISLLAIRTQKSMLSYSLPHWNVLFAIVPAMSYDFCLIPRKQQLPKHQPISWTKAFGETQGPSSEHRAQIFQLISLTTEIANRWHNEKAVPGAWSAPQTQLQSRALLTKDKREKKAKEKKKKHVNKTELPLSWFVVSFRTSSIFQAPSPTLSCLDSRKNLLPQTFSRWLSIFPRC